MATTKTSFIAKNGLVTLGKIGAGTLTPSTELEVVGTITATGAVVDNLKIGVSTANTIDTSSGNLTLDSAGGTVNVNDNLNVSGTITGSLSGNASTATSLQTSRTLWGQSFDGTGNVSGNLTSVGSITGTGALSITSTSGDLTLAATGTYNVVALRTAGAERARIDELGNIGFGTNDPTNYGAGYTALSVNGSTTGVFEIRSNDVVQGFILSDGSSDIQIQANGSRAIKLFTNSTEKVRVTAAGNVGINTTAPDQKLHVEGLVYSLGIKQKQLTVTPSATTNLDMSLANNFYITLDQNTTLAFTNPGNFIGVSGYILLKQDATGGRTITLQSMCKTPGARAIVQSTAANQLSLLTYYVVAADVIIVNYIGNFG